MRVTVLNYHTACVFFRVMETMVPSKANSIHHARLMYAAQKTRQCSSLYQNFVRENFTGGSCSEVYEVHGSSKLGKGSYGSVYLATHRVTGDERAVKVMNVDRITSYYLRKLHTEIAILKSLDHPNIIKLQDVFFGKRSVYIVTDLCRGGELFELLNSGKNQGFVFREDRASKLMKDMLSAVQYSEVMDALNIPTTRAGTCVTSDSTVIRDPYYDGRTVAEKCTVVSRIAPNFFPFGSFEIFKEKPVASASEGKGDYYRAGPSAGNDALKKQLFDYILLYYPELTVVEHSNTSKDKSEEQKMEKGMTIYDRLFHEIVTRTARLVAQWQSVGFVHGVMNTDNMSVMGLTIDYGPYGFMEYFDEQFVPTAQDGTLAVKKMRR